MNLLLHCYKTIGLNVFLSKRGVFLSLMLLYFVKKFVMVFFLFILVKI